MSVPMPQLRSTTAVSQRLRSEAYYLDDFPEEKQLLLAAASALESIETLRKTQHNLRSCSFCGSTEYYAKGLCKACYSRKRLNGHVEYKKITQAPYLCFPVPTPWYDQIAFAIIKSPTVLPADTESTIQSAIDSVTSERDRTILSLRFKDHKSLREIGKQLGLSAERVRQIQVSAIRKMRKYLKEREENK